MDRQEPHPPELGDPEGQVLIPVYRSGCLPRVTSGRIGRYSHPLVPHPLSWVADSAHGLSSRCPRHRAEQLEERETDT